MERPRISDETAEILEEIRQEYGYKDKEAAIKHLLRDSGYDV